MSVGEMHRDGRVHARGRNAKLSSKRVHLGDAGMSARSQQRARMNHHVGRLPVGKNRERDLAHHALAFIAQLPVAGEGDDVLFQPVEELPDERRVGDAPEAGISPLRL